MSNKKIDKVPKSDKTRLSDLAPHEQARGGVMVTPPGLIPPSKKGFVSVNRRITVPPF